MTPMQRRQRLTLALGIFLLAISIAAGQYFQPFIWHERYQVRSFDFWLRPLERNIDAALPEIAPDVHAVGSSRNGKCLWIAGANAFVAYSIDQGRSWKRLAYDSQARALQVDSNSPFPCAGPREARELSSGLFVPSVFAAQQQPGFSAPQRPPERQQAPAQQPPAQGKVTLSGSTTGPSLKISPTEIFFPEVKIGDTARRTVSLINLTDTDVHIINRPAFLSSKGSIELESPFELPDRAPADVAGSCPETVRKGTACGLDILYKPTIEGQTTWEVQFTDDRVPPSVYSVMLNGTGVPKDSKFDAAPAPSASPTKPPKDQPPRGTVGDAGKKTDKEVPAVPAIPPNFSSIGFSEDGINASLLGTNGDSLSTMDGGRYWSRTVSEITGWFFNGADKQWEKPPSTTTTIIGPFPSGLMASAQVSGKRLRWVTEKHSFEIGDGNGSWQPFVSSKPAGDIFAMQFVGSEGWALNEQSDLSVATQVLHSSNGGSSWETQSAPPLSPESRLLSIHIEPGGQAGWIGGASGRLGTTSGVLLRTLDGGRNWLPASREAARMAAALPPTLVPSDAEYMRFLPPWFLIVMVAFGWLVVPVLRSPVGTQPSKPDPMLKTGKEKPEPQNGPEPSVGNHPVSDKPLEPGEPDALELGKIASGLSFFLSNEQTKPPLVIGINGRWGSGKSSLMNLLKKKLESRGASPVWFNAWHHQKEEQLLAALLQAVKEQAVPSPLLWSGVRFRWNLFWNRLRRHWTYVLLAFAGWFLLHRAEHYLQNQPQPINVWTLMSYFLQFASIGNGGPINEPLTKLTGALAAYGVLSKLLIAFGSNPSTLLNAVGGKSNKKALEAQTSFRQQFAAEFNDVTRALPRQRRMLILIDDLDRCRPEKVREVLEAVNFLVSSGECFVILGMARDVVEHYVGLSFRPVVDGMSWEAMGLTDEDVRQIKAELGPVTFSKRDGESDPDIFARCRAFARLYLDKLVQIEVTIPVPTATQRDLLFEIQDEKQRRRRRWLSRFEAITAGTSKALQAAGIIFVLAVAAIFVGDGLKSSVTGFIRDLEDKTKQETLQRTENAEIVRGGLTQIADSLVKATSPQKGTDKTGAVIGGDTNSGKSGPNGKEPLQISVRVTGNDNPNPIVNPQTSIQYGVMGAWPFGLAMLFALGTILAYLLQEPQQDAEDKPPFTQALKIWHRLVMTSGAKNTPRSAKRFQNRVRYLAMRQRAVQESEPGSALVTWFGKTLKIKEPPQPSKNQDIATIPEPLLVAFAAIESYEPDWIQNEELFKTLVKGLSWELIAPEVRQSFEKSEYQLLFDALQASGWSLQTNLFRCREAYLKLTSELQHGTDVKKEKSKSAAKGAN